MKKSRKKKGFTLVELLIVIAITGILMAVAAPKYSGMIERANGVQNQSYAREVVNCIDMYNAEHPNEIIKEDDTLSSIPTVLKENKDFDEAVKGLEETIEKIKLDKQQIKYFKDLVKDGTKKPIE